MSWVDSNRMTYSQYVHPEVLNTYSAGGWGGGGAGAGLGGGRGRGSGVMGGLGA